MTRAFNRTVIGTGSVGVTVTPADRRDLAALDARAWHTEYSSLTVAAVRAATADRRWRTHLAVASVAGRPVAYLPCYVPVQQRLPANHSVADLFGVDVPPRRVVLLGSRGEMATDVVYAEELGPGERRDVGRVLVAGCTEFVGRRGAVAAALYVDAAEAATVFRSAAAHRVASGPNRLVLTNVGVSTDAYLAALSSGTRSIVRRDVRDFERAGLSFERLPAECVLGEAAPLVSLTKQAHGSPEPPVLVGFRLREWMNRQGEHAAYVVREGSVLVAVAFGAVVGRVLEMYEVGMVADHPARHAAYVRAILHAPLAHAQERDIHRILLGYGAERPKVLRGATRCPTTHILYQEEEHAEQH